MPPRRANLLTNQNWDANDSSEYSTIAISALIYTLVTALPSLIRHV